MRNARTIYSAAFSLLLSWCCFAQAPSKFYTRFGGSGYDYGYDIKQTLDGGYIIVGSTSSFGAGNTDVYLVKLDSMGTKKWERTFGSYNNDVGKSVVQLADSSYVMLGYTNSNGNGGYDMYLVKTDKSGNLTWQYTYGGTDWDFGYSLKATSDGGFIMCGTTYSFGRGQADGYIIKTNASGALQWNRTYGGAQDDEFKSVIQTSDGNYALAGYTKSYNDANGDAWIFKIDAAGDSLYSDSRGGAFYDFYNAVTELQNTNLYFSGGNRSLANDANSRTWNYCIDASNYQVWDYVDPGNNDEFYYGVVQGLNGVIASCGTTHNPVTMLDGVLDMLKSNFGYLNFAAQGSNDNDDEFYAIDKTRDKGFVMVGMTRGFNAELVDVFLFKTDSVGTFSNNITGINESSKNAAGISVFPNPTHGKINIRSAYNAPITIQVSDIAGRLIESFSFNAAEYSIDLSRYQAGTYILKLLNQENYVVKTEKVVLIN